jgi:hypothetical protein
MKVTKELFGANPNIPAWVADLIEFEPDSAVERMICKLDITKEQAISVMNEVLDEFFEPI